MRLEIGDRRQERAGVRQEMWTGGVGHDAWEGCVRQETEEGNRRQETGERRRETWDGRHETGDRRQGDRRQEAGGRETGDRETGRQEAGDGRWLPRSGGQGAPSVWCRGWPPQRWRQSRCRGRTSEWQAGGTRWDSLSAGGHLGRGHGETAPPPEWTREPAPPAKTPLVWPAPRKEQPARCWHRWQLAGHPCLPYIVVLAQDTRGKFTQGDWRQRKQCRQELGDGRQETIHRMGDRGDRRHGRQGRQEKTWDGRRETGDERQEIEDGRLETGDRRQRQETEDGRLETGEGSLASYPKNLVLSI